MTMITVETAGNKEHVVTDFLTYCKIHVKLDANGQ
jgi:hypothetical protein